ncbi:MAG TPA: hypothetical protein VK752_25825 [Bryobacteraceae bacterium]|jgi:hypothetical protein|nr:hypothetical protein [Bryobacteraceae bacterium]
MSDRRAALLALMKATALLGAVSGFTWVLHAYYFSRRFLELPLSLAWSLLTMVFVLMVGQAGLSAILKLRGARRRRSSSEITERLTVVLAEYMSGRTPRQQVTACAAEAPKHFEACLSLALLGARGSALLRLRELPTLTTLRENWIAKSRIGDAGERRYALDHLGMLQDPASISALEASLEDANPGVVAAAVRGLLSMPSYGHRERLLRSLGTRPFLVRVLAGECFDDAAPSARRVVILAPDRTEREMRAAVEIVTRLGFARSNDFADAAPTLGATGRDLLRILSAAGDAGEAPAEALSSLLTSLAKGVRA